MTKSLLSIIALILLGAPWTEASAQTQGEMNQDAASEFKAADKELNSIYQRLLEDYADDEAFIANLKEAQRCWIAFRDAQMKMKYPDREPGYYGSIQPMCEAIYLAELTQDRVKALRVWVEGVEEGDMCAGTVKVKE
ncbi:MAG: lysozyme inhibitor LprI family protein [Chthoniobacterales bacterium]